MGPHLHLATNLCNCPGVKNSSLEQKPNGTVVVTVHGGNPETVAGMIKACLPPGTDTDGDTLVKVDGVVVGFNHVDPNPELPAAYVAPMPLVDFDGQQYPAKRSHEGGWSFRLTINEGGLLFLLLIGVLIWAFG